MVMYYLQGGSRVAPPRYPGASRGKNAGRVLVYLLLVADAAL